MNRPDPNATLSLRQWPLLVVVLGVLAGLVVVMVGESTWRPGSLLIGASLVVGALERLLLPSRGAGLLEVRSKPFDVGVLALAGIAVLVLAVAVPAGR